MAAEAAQRAAGPSPAIGALIGQMKQICGPDSVLSDPAQLATYECDGLTAHRCSPGPQSHLQTPQIRRTVT